MPEHGRAGIDVLVALGPRNAEQDIRRLVRVVRAMIHRDAEAGETVPLQRDLVQRRIEWNLGAEEARDRKRSAIRLLRYAAGRCDAVTQTRATVLEVEEHTREIAA